MNRLLRNLAVAATGAIAVSIYRQWQQNSGKSHRHHLENWENEGGALPEAPPPSTDNGAHPRRWDS